MGVGQPVAVESLIEDVLPDSERDLAEQPSRSGRLP